MVSAIGDLEVQRDGLACGRFGDSQWTSSWQVSQIQARRREVLGIVWREDRYWDSKARDGCNSDSEMAVM